jgi:hypothetical protein
MRGARIIPRNQWPGSVLRPERCSDKHTRGDQEKRRAHTNPASAAKSLPMALVFYANAPHETLRERIVSITIFFHHKSLSSQITNLRPSLSRLLARTTVCNGTFQIAGWMPMG